MRENTSSSLNLSSFINVSNGQWSDENTTYYEDDFLLDSYRHVSTYIVVLAAWSFVANILVIWACIQPRSQRKDAYYSHIINYSLANIMISTFVLPLTAYDILYPWELGQFACKTWIIADVLLPFVLIIIDIITNLDHLILISHPALNTFLNRKWPRYAIMALPWLLACLVVLPLWTVGAVPYDPIDYQCIVMIETAAGLLCPMLTYFIPLVIITILTFKLLLLWLQFEDTGLPGVMSTERTADNWRNIAGQGSMAHSLEGCNGSSTVNRKETDRPMDGHSPESAVTIATARCHLTGSSTRTGSTLGDVYKTGSLMSVCLLNFSFTVMWFPFQCVSFLSTLCSHEMCAPSLHLTQVITLIAASSSGVTPLCWLADKTLKASLVTIFRNICSHCIWHQDKAIATETTDVEETFV